MMLTHVDKEVGDFLHEAPGESHARMHENGAQRMKVPAFRAAHLRHFQLDFNGLSYTRQILDANPSHRMDIAPSSASMTGKPPSGIHTELDFYALEIVLWLCGNPTFAFE